MTAESVLQTTGLRRSFEQGGVVIEVLRGVDLTVRKGEIVALLGPSGSGKSTMLQAVGLLERPSLVRVRIAGRIWSSTREPHAVRPRLCSPYVCQSSSPCCPFHASVSIIARPQMIPLHRARTCRGTRPSCSLAGPGERLTAPSSQLSGGEQPGRRNVRALAITRSGAGDERPHSP